MIVSELIRGEIRGRFSERDADDALRMFETTSLAFLDLPAPTAAQHRERDRVHLAVLKLSAGNVMELARALDIARIDWRDTLVGAGMGHDNWPDILRETGFPVP
jgi:hypothetical protein